MSDSMFALEYAVLHTPDVEKAVEYYQEVLGFSVDWVFGKPPVAAGCGVQLQFSRGRSLLCFRVDDVDALHQNYRDSGAKIVAAPSNNSDSQMREMDIEDSEGNLLRFVQPLHAKAETSNDCPCLE
ncbi:MAG TPA: VOC family protein [Abditibacteriaceae bacterium]|jgi:catechol 2,3-dioxygenase-like lactoylglutathione lyase family enzyme